jgi:hypothetical protein
MSAIGPKQTSHFALHMSALRGKADTAYDPKRTSLVAPQMSADMCCASPSHGGMFWAPWNRFVGSNLAFVSRKRAKRRSP